MKTITQRPPLTNCPAWADPRRTETFETNDYHYSELRRWRASADDVDIRLDLTRCDEYALDDTREFLLGDTRARLHLENDACCYREPDGREIPIACDVDLTVDDCRRLAAHLLIAAERIENVVAANSPTVAAEMAAAMINGHPWGVAKVECRDCECAFHPDSSPHADRCQACAERVDGLATP